eukprot:7965466-Ditylum_brightwellii.AAC.1
MNATDKDIWDCSYVEEYFGLHSNTHTWQYIIEQEYLELKPHMGHTLPTIALAIIKPDEHSKPQQAKCCICILGNMDPNSWSKNDCYAPVMTEMEMCLLDAAAVQLKNTGKGGDFKQASFQSFLPLGRITFYACQKIVSLHLQIHI